MRLKSIQFGNHPVLGNFKLDFCINGNVRIFSLLAGENGCGKTVLMEEIFDIFSHGIRLWDDNIDRIITIELSDNEKAELEINNVELTFDYKESYSESRGWTRVKILDEKGQDLSRNLLGLITNPGRFNKMMKCAYSPVEINFSSKEIESVRATSIDSEKNPKQKASADLASEIAQLIVDIDSQDNAEGNKWLKENQGKIIGEPIPKISYKLDRFRKAYSKMFVDKELKEIRQENGKHNIIFADNIKNVSFSLSGLSSGEKQVVYRAGYLLRNLSNLTSGIILIDEPELSLHPKWQEKYMTFLRDMFEDSHKNSEVQFIISTHSPIILKESLESDVGTFILQKNRSGNIQAKNIFSGGFGVLNWSPTWGEVAYDAYGMYTQEFHDDLYAMLQVTKGCQSVRAMERWFVGNNYNIDPVTWTNSSGTTETETLMTFIRNKMHHGDNGNRRNFRSSELEKSIKSMLNILKN